MSRCAFHAVSPSACVEVLKAVLDDEGQGMFIV